MKVIDCSPLRGEEGTLNLPNRLQGVWQYGLRWDNEQKAQEMLIEHLQKNLDNNYTMVRDATLPGIEIPIPLVLVGPTGIRLIYASGLKGIYRAKTESWLTIDTRTRRFKPVRPNLVARTLLMAKIVQKYLAEKVQRELELEPILFFSQPGIHVETMRPALRILLVDALDRLASSILQSPPLLNQTEARYLANILSKAKPAPAKEKPGAGESITKKNFRIGKLRLPVWQWLMLGLMAFFEICIVIVFIAIIVIIA